MFVVSWDIALPIGLSSWVLWSTGWSSLVVLRSLVVGLVVMFEGVEPSVRLGGPKGCFPGLVMIAFSSWLILWVHFVAWSIHSSSYWRSGSSLRLVKTWGDISGRASLRVNAVGRSGWISSVCGSGWVFSPGC